MAYFDITDFATLEIDCIYTTVFRQKQEKSDFINKLDYKHYSIKILDTYAVLFFRP